MSSNFIIILKKKYLFVYSFNKLILKQIYIKNKIYTLFFVLHFLYKYGLLNKIFN